MTCRRLSRLPRATVLGREVPVATGFRARLLGLAGLDRERAGPGLLIPRCSSVHTVGMRFALDVVFLDRSGTALGARRGVGPRRVVFSRGADAVLEVPSDAGFGGATAFGAASPEKMNAHEIQVPPLSLERLRELVEPDAWDRFAAGLARGRELLGERQVWNVNSTASGGGVAEMLWSWVGLARGIGVPMRWLTIGGEAEFFAITKRLHNYLHGELGDGGELGEEERAVYERISRENAEDLIDRFGPEDVIFLHDPQTAGLVPHLAGAERKVVWRCHIGADDSNDLTAAGWDFLSPYVKQADAVVFSRRAFVPDFAEAMLTAIVPPSIDAFSPKNQEMDEAQVRAILLQAGLLAGEPEKGALPSYLRPDGTEALVARRALLAGAGTLPDNGTPLVVQVSRWDRLKDPVGVMRGFAEALDDGREAHLVLAGPSLGSVTDDPDGATVLAEVEADWERLPEEARARVTIACLPMDDLEENAAIVNALQRRAAIVVQKSLKEGFGLTVTEAMWKARPLVATATGGIADQIENGINGLLLRDPLDLKGFAELIAGLLDAPARAVEIGRAAREKVRSTFLEDRHTLQYVELLERLIE